MMDEKVVYGKAYLFIVVTRENHETNCYKHARISQFL